MAVPEVIQPYLFEVYQKREDVPAVFKASLITPFDPTIPVKCWIDSTIPTDEERDTGFRLYKVLRQSVGGFHWDPITNKPHFKTITVPVELLNKLNIAPKDFAGKLQEIPTLPEWPCPVQTTPPEGYTWFNSMGLVPVFKLKATLPVTLEDIFDEIKKMRTAFDEFLRRTP